MVVVFTGIALIAHAAWAFGWLRFASLNSYQLANGDGDTIVGTIGLVELAGPHVVRLLDW
jgi:hypothetical protein